MNPVPILHMDDFLQAVAEHGINVPEVLSARGVPSKVLAAKAEKASSKGYYDYGTTCCRGWLTDKGRAYLASAPHR